MFSSTNAFNHGRYAARGVVDMADAMAADFKVWRLGTPDFHAGFWHEMVKREHNNRLNSGDDTALRAAQISYNRIANLIGEGE